MAYPIRLSFSQGVLAYESLAGEYSVVQKMYAGEDYRESFDLNLHHL
jgi:hypothetical protein